MWELIICILAIKFFLLQKLIVLWYSWCWQWFLWTSSIKKQDVLGTSLTVTSFESTNTPLETWIVVLDSWIKEHKLQARALIEKKLLLLKHSGHSILLPPPIYRRNPVTLTDIYFSSHHSSPILVQTIVCQLLVLRICLLYLSLIIQ